MELCDIDNDGDGETDEGLSQACVVGWAAGNQVCTAGVDNHCDGDTDPLFPTVGMACDGADSDVCEHGSYTCNAPEDGVECVNEDPVDIPEVCNSLDDDCDGETDEEGTWTAPGGGDCGDTDAGVSPGEVELCDGIDNDCNDHTDEDPVDPGLPMVESCYTGPMGTEGVGECAAGVSTCTAGAWGTCAGEVVPTTETCDGLDQDCDNVDDDDEPSASETAADHPCFAEPQCEAAICYCYDNAGSWSCILD